MGKKKNKKEFPSIEKLSSLGFKDGYNGNKSKEDELITNFCKRRISSEEITPRIIAYSLGYKKGILIYLYGVDKCKIMNDKIFVNNKEVKIDEIKENEINQKVMLLSKPSKKKGRR